MDSPRHQLIRPGQPMDPDQVRDLIWKNLVVYAWKQGDVVAVDNNRIGHGRLPYSGPRMVAVCWA